MPIRDTLTYSNIENKAEYSASSVEVNVDTSADAKLNEKGITPNIGIPIWRCPKHHTVSNFSSNHTDS